MKKILALAFVVLLAACAGTPIDWNKARSVNVGMTEKELIEKMGSPTAVRAQGDKQAWAYVHVNGLTGTTETVSFVMKDGKVADVPPIPASF